MYVLPEGNSVLAGIRTQYLTIHSPDTYPRDHNTSVVLAYHALLALSTRYHLMSCGCKTPTDFKIVVGLLRMLIQFLILNPYVVLHNVIVSSESFLLLFSCQLHVAYFSALLRGTT